VIPIVVPWTQGSAFSTVSVKKVITAGLAEVVQKGIVTGGKALVSDTTPYTTPESLRLGFAAMGRRPPLFSPVQSIKYWVRLKIGSIDIYLDRNAAGTLRGR
jgi:hypothetical protein